MNPSLVRLFSTIFLSLACCGAAFAGGVNSVSVSKTTMTLGESLSLKAYLGHSGLQASCGLIFKITRPNGSTTTVSTSINGTMPYSKSLSYTPTMSGSHSVKAYFSGVYWPSGSPYPVGLSGTPCSSKTFSVSPPNTAPIGHFDSITSSVTRGSSVSANGWAADNEMGSPITRVDVYLDGVDVANAALGGVRNDVANAYGRSDYTNSGWNWSYNTSGLSLGSHSVYVKYRDNGGLTKTLSSKTFTVVNSVPSISSVSVSSTSPNEGSSVVLTATASDSDGTANVRFREGSSQQGSTSSSASSKTHSVTVSGKAPGAHAYHARATDNNGATRNSSNRTVTWQNVLPTISNLTGPTTVNEGQTVTVSATASDAHGSISSVKFYRDGNLKKTDTNSAYNYSYTRTSPGSHVFRALATDTENSTKWNNNKTITWLNVLPTVSLSVSSTSRNEGQSVTLTAAASDAYGSITSVKFYVVGSTTPIGTDTSAPFTHSPIDVTPGTRSYYAVATDDESTTKQSNTKAVTWKNKKPTVSLQYSSTIPLVEGVSVTLLANAQDAHGSITNVKFYEGVVGNSTLLHTDNSYPFSHVHSHPDCGNRNYYAIATDNDQAGALSVSNPSNVLTVFWANVKPDVSLTASTYNLDEGENLVLTADATDLAGVVSRVDFYENGSSSIQHTDYTANASNEFSYTFTQTIPMLGERSYYVIATDDDNGGATSIRQCADIQVTWNNLQPVLFTSVPTLSSSEILVGESATVLVSANDPGGLKYIRFFRNDILEYTITDPIIDPSDLEPDFTYTYGDAQYGNQIFKVEVEDHEGSTNITSTVILSVDDLEAPTVPAGLVLSSETESSFTVVWNPSSDNGNLVGYDVQCDSGSGFDENVFITVSSESVVIQAIAQGLTHLVRVRARDEAGNVSGWSNVFSHMIDVNPALDSDGDGMPDYWERSMSLDPSSISDAEDDPDDDKLTNLEEFQAGSNPYGGDGVRLVGGYFVFHVKAKRSGSGASWVKLAFNSGKTHTFYFDSVASGTWGIEEWDSVSLAYESRDVTVTTSGVSDYAILVRQGHLSKPLHNNKVLLNEARVDGLVKSEIDGNSGEFSVRLEPFGVLPFAIMDISKLESKRVIRFGLGHDVSGQSPGFVTFELGSHKPVTPTSGYNRPTIGVFKGAGATVSGTFDNGGTMEVTAPSGYLEIEEESVSLYHMRFFLPDQTTLVSTYSFALSTPDNPQTQTWDGDRGVVIMRTIGSDVRVFELLSHWEKNRQVSSASINSGGNPYSLTTEIDDWTAYLNIWPWRKQSASRPDLVEIKYVAHSETEYTTNSPPAVTNKTISLHKSIYDGSNNSGTLVFYECRDFSPNDDSLSYQPLVIEKGVNSLSENYTEYQTFSEQTVAGKNGLKQVSSLGGVTFTELYRGVINANLGSEPLISDGEVKETRQSFLDDEVGSASDIVTSYKYDAALIDGRTVPKTVVRSQDGVEIGRTEFTNTTEIYNDSSAVKIVAKNYYYSGNYLESTLLSYSRRLTEDLSGKPIYTVRPNGTKSSYGYERGTLNTNTGSWTKSIWGNHFMVVELSGIEGSTVSSLMPSGASSSIAVSSLSMQSNRSTATERVVDERGNLLREVTYVYTGGSGFEVIAAAYNEYDLYANLTETRDGPFGSSSSRILYEATYVAYRKTSEIDALGVKQVYVHDNYDRIETVTKKGVGTSGSAGYQPDVVTKFEYNAAGQVTKQIVGYGVTDKQLTTTTTYDTSGRLSSRKNPGISSSTIVDYSDTDKTITTTILPTGATQIQNLFKDGRPDTITGTAVPAVSYAYFYRSNGFFVTDQTLTATGAWSERHTDWLGRELKLVEPTHDGGTRITKNLHNEIGQLILMQVKDGLTHLLPNTIYEYDSYGRLLRSGNNSHETSSSYGGTTVIDTANDTNVIDYYSDFRKDGGNWFLYESQSDYPYEDGSGAGVPTARTLSESFVQLSGFSAGVLSHAYGYDAFENYSTATVAVNRTTKTLTSTVHAQGAANELVKTNINGLLTQVKDAQGNDHLLEYDDIGRLSKEIDPRLTASNPTEYAYKVDSPLIDYVQRPDNTQIHYGYDTAGRVNWQNTDVAGGGVLKQYTRLAYDNLSNVTHRWGSGVTPVKYEYNAIGQRTKMRTYRGESGWIGSSQPSAFSGAGDLTQWVYHATTGLLVQKTDATAEASTFTYDDVGRFKTRLDARGVTTTYSYYDQASASVGNFTGALKKQDYPSSVVNNVQVTPDVEFTYHRNGGYKTVKDTAGTRTFKYYETYASSDGQAKSGLLKSETFDSSLFGGKALTHAYHFAGNPANIGITPNGARESVQYQSSASYMAQYAYDEGRLDSVSGGSGYASIAFGYTYTPDSSLVQEISSGTFSRTYAYESDSNRIASIEQYDGATRLAEIRVDYDSYGRKLREKQKGSIATQLGRSSGFASEFTYNSANATVDPQASIDRDELIASAKYLLSGANDWSLASSPIGNTVKGYQYDAIGNRTLDIDGAYAVNSLNQVADAPFDSGAWTYDDSGNLLADGKRAYEYDAENRMVEMTYSGGTYQFKYDYMGRRISKKKVGGSETRYVYDGWNLIAETNTSGSVTRSFVWGTDVSGSLQGAGGVGGLLMIKDGAAEYYPLYDSSHNVIGLANSSGTIVAAYEYDDYGNVVDSSGAYAKSNPFRYSTKYTDDLTSAASGPREGLVYYGLRYYNPESGRFLNRDPIAENGGLNLYGFVGNSPVNRYDYLGMQDNPFVDEDGNPIADMFEGMSDALAKKPTVDIYKTRTVGETRGRNFDEYMQDNSVNLFRDAAAYRADADRLGKVYIAKNRETGEARAYKVYEGRIVAEANAKSQGTKTNGQGELEVIESPITLAEGVTYIGEETVFGAGHGTASVGKNGGTMSGGGYEHYIIVSGPNGNLHKVLIESGGFLSESIEDGSLGGFDVGVGVSYLKAYTSPAMLIGSGMQATVGVLFFSGTVLMDGSGNPVGGGGGIGWSPLPVAASGFLTETDFSRDYLYPGLEGKLLDLGDGDVRQY